MATVAITGAGRGIGLELTRQHVAAGDRVEPGQPLATVEAMKMENILRSQKSGVVAKIHAPQGASVAADEVILELE